MDPATHPQPPLQRGTEYQANHELGLAKQMQSIAHYFPPGSVEFVENVLGKLLAWQRSVFDLSSKMTTDKKKQALQLVFIYFHLTMWLILVAQDKWFGTGGKYVEFPLMESPKEVASSTMFSSIVAIFFGFSLVLTTGGYFILFGSFGRQQLHLLRQEHHAKDEVIVSTPVAAIFYLLVVGAVVENHLYVAKERCAFTIINLFMNIVAGHYIFSGVFLSNLYSIENSLVLFCGRTGDLIFCIFCSIVVVFGIVVGRDILSLFPTEFFLGLDALVAGTVEESNLLCNTLGAVIVYRKFLELGMSSDVSRTARIGRSTFLTVFGKWVGGTARMEVQTSHQSTMKHAASSILHDTISSMDLIGVNINKNQQRVARHRIDRKKGVGNLAEDSAGEGEQFWLYIYVVYVTIAEVFANCLIPLYFFGADLKVSILAGIVLCRFVPLPPFQVITEGDKPAVYTIDQEQEHLVPLDGTGAGVTPQAPQLLETNRQEQLVNHLEEAPPLHAFPFLPVLQTNFKRKAYRLFSSGRLLDSLDFQRIALKQNLEHVLFSLDSSLLDVSYIGKIIQREEWASSELAMVGLQIVNRSLSLSSPADIEFMSQRHLFLSRKVCNSKIWLEMTQNVLNEINSMVEKTSFDPNSQLAATDWSPHITPQFLQNCTSFVEILKNCFHEEGATEEHVCEDLKPMFRLLISNLPMLLKIVRWKEQIGSPCQLPPPLLNGTVSESGNVDINISFPFTNSNVPQRDMLRVLTGVLTAKLLMWINKFKRSAIKKWNKFGFKTTNDDETLRLSSHLGGFNVETAKEFYFHIGEIFVKRGCRGMTHAVHVGAVAELLKELFVFVRDTRIKEEVPGTLFKSLISLRCAEDTSKPRLTNAFFQAVDNDEAKAKDIIRNLPPTFLPMKGYQNIHLVAEFSKIAPNVASLVSQHNFTALVHELVIEPYFWTVVAEEEANVVARAVSQHREATQQAIANKLPPPPPTHVEPALRTKLVEVVVMGVCRHASVIQQTYENFLHQSKALENKNNLVAGARAMPNFHLKVMHSSTSLLLACFKLSPELKKLTCRIMKDTKSFVTLLFAQFGITNEVARKKQDGEDNRFRIGESENAPPSTWLLKWLLENGVDENQQKNMQQTIVYNCEILVGSLLDTADWPTTVHHVSDEGVEADEVCVICTEPLVHSRENGKIEPKLLTSMSEKLVKLPCGHFFHSPCAFLWLLGNKNCPLCRKIL